MLYLHRRKGAALRSFQQHLTSCRKLYRQPNLVKIRRLRAVINSNQQFYRQILSLKAPKVFKDFKAAVSAALPTALHQPLSPYEPFLPHLRPQRHRRIEGLLVPLRPAGVHELARQPLSRRIHALSGVPLHRGSPPRQDYLPSDVASARRRRTPLARRPRTVARPPTANGRSTASNATCSTYSVRSPRATACFQSRISLCRPPHSPSLPTANSP